MSNKVPDVHNESDQIDGLPGCDHPLCKLAAFVEVVTTLYETPDTALGPLLFLMELTLQKLKAEGKTPPNMKEAIKQFADLLTEDVKRRIKEGAARVFEVDAAGGTKELPLDEFLKVAQIDKDDNKTAETLNMSDEEFQRLKLALNTAHSGTKH